MMNNTPPIQRLLGSTRGEILSLVCNAPRTIGALTEEMRLTPNAIRGQLAILERDGLVRRTVTRQGVGKPAHLYEATSGGRGLLSRAYQPALSAILRVLTDRLAPADFEGAMREAGHRLGLPHSRSGGNLRSRIGVALRALEGLGSVARIEYGEEEGAYVICGQCCPLADLVAEHPEVCAMVETMLSDIVGAPVREHCHKGATPSCRFAIAGAADGA